MTAFFTEFLASARQWLFNPGEPSNEMRSERSNQIEIAFLGLVSRPLACFFIRKYNCTTVVSNNYTDNRKQVVQVDNCN